MAPTETDNSYLSDKVALRLGHLPPGYPLRVLDCYGGSGKIWAGVKKLSGRDIRILPIDIKDYGFHLPGDNRAYLGSIDLGRFDVIDLDAYGVPYEQIKDIFDRGYSGIVFVTFNQSVYGQMPHGLLRDVGFSDSMISKIPTLFAKRGWFYFLTWLGKNGITQIWHRSKNRKHYLGFVSGAAGSGGDYDNP